MTTLRVKLNVPNATKPTRSTKGSAGYDLYCVWESHIPPKSVHVCDTGISVQIMEGHYGRIAPRSSLSKKLIDVGAGVIDSDYRGPLKVILYNLSDKYYHIESGDRIAQLILEKISTPEVEIVESLEDTERGEGGFGSTGK